MKANISKSAMPALVLFGQDFEKHGGLRAVVIDRCEDDHSLSWIEEMIEVCDAILGRELAEEGMRYAIRSDKPCSCLFPCYVIRSPL